MSVFNKKFPPLCVVKNAGIRYLMNVSILLNKSWRVFKRFLNYR
jgi:hypothetical protein